MAVNKPDAYQHNNPDLAFVDADFVRGGGRVVSDLTALYALSTKADQLKVRVTRVWVTSEAKYYVLVDNTKINQSAGWTIETTGGGSGTPGVSVTNATINGSGHLIITLSDNTTIDAGVSVGPQGTAGSAGATGNGIASSSYNASTGVLTITYTSGGTYSTGDLRGAAGATGAAGSKWYNGAGAPSAGTGVSGDYYLNTTNGDVYVKTTSWAVLTNIKGATGATGATGSAGANGATWLSGSSAPATQGVNGDFYLNTTTYDVSLKTAGTWNVVVNIKGATGNTGATGSTGATGATGKGISSITKTNTVGQIDTYTITYTDSTTTTFDVVNGANYVHPPTHPTAILDGVDTVNGAEDYYLNKKGEFKKVEAGSSETGLTIRAKLEGLTGGDKLNYSALQGVVSSYTLDFRDDVTQIQDINIEGAIRIDAIQVVNVATLQLGAVTLTLPLSAPINIAQGAYNVWTITRNTASAASVGIKYTKL